MSDLSTLRDSVLGLFRTEWNGQTPISWQNVPFTPPEESWIRVGLYVTDVDQGSLSGGITNLWKYTGTFVVEVFTRVGQGPEAADTLVQNVLAILEGATLGRRLFSNWRIEEPGAAGVWYQHVVTSDFRYDVIR